jgi:hypothetical protein
VQLLVPFRRLCLQWRAQVTSTLRSNALHLCSHIQLAWGSEPRSRDRLSCVTVKLSLCLINLAPCDEHTGESGGIAPPYLTSTLHGGEWPALCPGRFIPGKITPGTNWLGGWVGTRAGIRIPAVQPEACCYTDWAIPAPLTIYLNVYYLRVSSISSVRCQGSTLN